MNISHETRAATAKQYCLNSYGGDRQHLTKDFVEKNGKKYLKLVSKIPDVLDPWFGDMARRLALECTESKSSYDQMYRISWFSKNLEKIYQGKERVSVVPLNWEDEHEFLQICEKFSNA